MTESIAVALITGGLSLLGVVLSNLATGRRTDEALRLNQAVIDTRLTALTQEVREHNGFARRMPVVEEQIRVMNHRIADLERRNQEVRP